MNSCAKCDKDTLMQHLYEIHLVQKGVTFSQALVGKTEEEKEHLLLDKMLNDLFIVRIDRDPGFYSYVLQEIFGDKYATQAAIRYINKIFDDYSVSFESFLLRDSFVSDIGILHFDLEAPESFLQVEPSEEKEVPCSSPLSGRDLKQICRFYEFWSEQELSEKDEMRDAVIRNVLHRLSPALQFSRRGFHHAGVFEIPVVDQIITGGFSGKKKWKTIAENFIRQNLRNPRVYIEEYIHHWGVPYHLIHSNGAREFQDLTILFRKYFSEYRKNPDYSSCLDKTDACFFSEAQIPNEIFLSDALLIAAEIWFSKKPNRNKIDLLNRDYSGYSPKSNAGSASGNPCDNYWHADDAIDFFQYETAQAMLESTPRDLIDEDRYRVTDIRFALMQYHTIIDTVESDFFNSTERGWRKCLNVPGNLLASYLVTKNREKASEVIQHLVATDFSEFPDSYPPFFDSVIGEIVIRTLNAAPDEVLSIIEEIRSEIEKYRGSCSAMQFMIRMLRDAKCYTQGIASVEKFIEEYPDVPWIWQMHYEHGIMLSEKGDAEQALKSFKQALESFNSYTNIKADIYFQQALAHLQLGHWTEAYTSTLNSIYLLYPGNKDCQNLRNQLKYYLSKHIDIDSVRCSDARYAFTTAERQAMDYLIKTPDKEQIDFYSPVMSLAKGLEILLDQEIWVNVREELKESEYWDDTSGIREDLFNDIQPKNLKWALSREERRRESISLGTWSRFDFHKSQDHRVIDFINRYLENRYGKSFEEIQSVCRFLTNHRNGVAHSRLMDKDTAKTLYSDSITLINSVIRILYGEKQCASPKIMIFEMENDDPGTLLSRGRTFLEHRDFEFADLVFSKALEKLEDERNNGTGNGLQGGVPMQYTTPHNTYGSIELLAQLYVLKGIAQKSLKNIDSANKCFQLAKAIDPEISDETIQEKEEWIQRRIDIRKKMPK